MEVRASVLKTRERSNTVFVIFLVLSLVVHFVLLIPALGDSSRLFTWPDSFCYERLGINILQGNGYSIADTPPWLPNSTMTPLYPLFIAGIYSVFGRSPYAVMAVQIVLSLGLIAAVAWFACRGFSAKPGLLAGILMSLNLCFAFYSTQIMTDVLFLSLLLPALWFAFKAFNGNSPVKSGLAAGAFFGLAALTRPIALYFPVLLPVLFLVKKPNRRTLAGYGLMLLIHVAVISPWLVRNRVVFERFFFSTVQSFNLSHIHAAPIKASIEGKSLNQAEAELERSAFQKYGEPRNEAERFIFTGREAFVYILRHPGRYALLYLTGAIKTLLPLGFAEFLMFYAPAREGIRNITPAVQKAILDGDVKEIFKILWDERIAPVGWMFVIYVAAFFFNIFLMVMAVKGFLKKGFKTALNLLAFIAAVYFLGVTGPAGQPRHFLPVLVFVVLLSVHGFFSRKEPKAEASA